MLAFRPAPVRPLLATALATAERDGRVIEHPLRTLSFADAQSLLGDGIPAPVRGEIFEAGGGNPFFLQQLARQHAAGRSVAAEPGEAGVPRAVMRALEQEIAALERGGPRAGAGRGGRGRPRGPGPRDRRRRSMPRRRRSRSMRSTSCWRARCSSPTDTPRRYRFRHPLVRHAIYDSAAGGWRIGAHGRAAAALQARGGSLAARAHHLERCARPGDAEAVSVLVEAGRHAAARAPATAADRFAAALRLLPETPETLPARLELLVGLAQARAATGRLEAALESLDAGLSLVGPELAPVRARLVAGCAMCENLLGRHGAAHARLLAREGGAGRGLVRGRRPGGGARRRRAVRQRLRRRRRLGAAGPGDRVGRRRARVRGRRDRAGVLRRARARRGSPRRRRCARTPPPSSTRSTTARSSGRLDTAYYLGFAEFFCEHYDDAIRHFRRGISVSRASGQGQFVIPMTIGLAHALEVRGRLDEAAEAADAAVEGARLWGNDQMLCFALTADAWVSALRGELDRARSAGAEAMALLDGLDESVLSRATRVHVAAAQLEAGEPEGCLAAMSAGGAPEFAGVEPGRRAWLYAILARAELALGRPGAAADWVRARRGRRRRPRPPLRRSLRALRPRAARRQTRRRRVAARRRRAAARPPRRARPSRAAELADSVGAVIQASRARDPRRAGQRRRGDSCSSGPRPTSAASARPGCATRPRASCGSSA